MNHARFASLCFALVTSFGAIGSAPAEACPPSLPIDERSVAEAIDGMLRAESMPVTATRPLLAIRRAELDGDRETSEALVDVVHADLCGPAMLCPTLVVLSRGGRLVSAGSGHALVMLQGSTAGYRDLGDQSPSLIPFVPVVTRALRWNVARYVP